MSNLYYDQAQRSKKLDVDSCADRAGVVCGKQRDNCVDQGGGKASKEAKVPEAQGLGVNCMIEGRGTRESRLQLW